MFEGHDYRVRGAFPGDEVEVQVERIFKFHNIWASKAKRFVKKGPHHIKRSCSHTRPCPACPLHDANLELEQQVKRDRIINALKEQGINFEVSPVVPHPNRLGYRQKVKLMVGGGPGDLKLGVYVPYSHKFKEAGDCPHVNPAINQAVKELMPIFNNYRVEGLQAIILRAGQDGVAGIFVTTQAIPEVAWEKISLLSAKERIQDQKSNSLLGGVVGKIKGPRKIRSLEDGQLVDPEAFCQTDPAQAQRLYELVADFLWQGEGRYVDAFAGVGGFSKALLKKGACEITAIESNPVCKESLEALELSCQRRLASSSIASSILDPSLRWDDNTLGLVLDPPKKGLMDEAEAYASTGAKRVALVSCDPKSMAQDLKILLKHGYKVQKIIPVDLFGATPAVETVVLLER